MGRLAHRSALKLDPEHQPPLLCTPDGESRQFSTQPCCWQGIRMGTSRYFCNQYACAREARIKACWITGLLHGRFGAGHFRKLQFKRRIVPRPAPTWGSLQLHPHAGGAAAKGRGSSSLVPALELSVTERKDLYKIPWQVRPIRNCWLFLALVGHNPRVQAEHLHSLGHIKGHGNKSHARNSLNISTLTS